MNILITGAAGFIGFSTCKYFLEKKNKVIGIDNLDNYYSTLYKKKRISKLNKFKNFKFLKVDITNKKRLFNSLKKEKISYIFHFAAQAGVRYSLIKPDKYVKVNILGFDNIIQLSQVKKVKKFLYASSSSVYGDNTNYPLNEKTDLNPKNIYGMSKKYNEEMAEFYSNLYGINMIGLRFFTVFGEWGRPDMFINKFLNCSYSNTTFELNNGGNHYRDFTYIGDLIFILNKLYKIKLKKKHIVFNICSGNSKKITKVINHFARSVQKPKILLKPLQNADIIKTHGDNKKIKKFIKNIKYTNFFSALDKTNEWFKNNKIYKFF